MAGPSHPHAMAPSKPGRTRTAPPMQPATWWGSKRIRNYLLFDATGFIYLLVGFVALRAVLALGEGPEAWAALLESYANPLYILFHLITLVSVIFVGVRFFSLFPKAQPKAIGPAKPPPGPVIVVMLYAAWIGLTLVFSLILAGVLF